MFLAGLKNLRRRKRRLLEAGKTASRMRQGSAALFRVMHAREPAQETHQTGQKNAISGVPAASTTSESGSPSRPLVANVIAARAHHPGVALVRYGRERNDFATIFVSL